MNDNFDREKIKALVQEALLQNQSALPITTLTDESLKDVITEAEVKNLASGSNLLIREDAIITPSARDLIHELSLNVSYRKNSKQAGKTRTIALGADHGGFETKELLKRWLSEMGYQFRDFGTTSADAVDYPDFAHAVARAVADGACELGIILDGAGIGSCMTANKVPGIRAAMCYDEASAKNSREHNYANVLTLGAKMLSAEQIKIIVTAWLNTPEGEARHGKRVDKIMAIEKQYLK
jgi:ribose 5-phosphate isomerase B